MITQIEHMAVVPPAREHERWQPVGVFVCVLLAVQCTISGCGANDGHFVVTGELGLRILASEADDGQIVRLARLHADTVWNEGELVATWETLSPCAVSDQGALNSLIRRSADGGGHQVLVLKGEYDIEPKHLKGARARAQLGPQGELMFAVSVPKATRDRLSQLTGSNKGRQIAVMANGEVCAVPDILTAIESFAIYARCAEHVIDPAQ